MPDEQEPEDPATSLTVFGEHVQYVAMTLLGTSDGRIVSSFFSEFVRYHDLERRVELREPGIVSPHRMAETWQLLGEAYMVVNDVQAFAHFFGAGGNALVDRRIVAAMMPRLLEPSPMVGTGEYGFTSSSDLPATAFHRAPTPRHRMRVLKRDEGHCKICGRSPQTNVDIELHVHHIRPWGIGGLTVDENLITLCHTCHHGLDPHEDHSLFELVEPSVTDIKARSRDYVRGVLQYREALRALPAPGPRRRPHDKP
jgi:5-methylcytosine-specific restriction endonuclease McrA